MTVGRLFAEPVSDDICYFLHHRDGGKTKIKEIKDRRNFNESITGFLPVEVTCGRQISLNTSW